MMGCGCADRMRKWVLPRLGFFYWEGLWINDSGDDLEIIQDEEVEKHNAMLTARLVGRRVARAVAG